MRARPQSLRGPPAERLRLTGALSARSIMAWVSLAFSRSIGGRAVGDCCAGPARSGACAMGGIPGFRKLWARESEREREIRGSQSTLKKTRLPCRGQNRGSVKFVTHMPSKTFSGSDFERRFKVACDGVCALEIYWRGISTVLACVLLIILNFSGGPPGPLPLAPF